MAQETVISKKIKKKNPWMFSTIIAALATIILLGLLVMGGGITGLTGRAISEKDASDKLVDYLNTVTGGGVTLTDAEDIGNLYRVSVDYQGQEIPVYITKDGKYFVSNAISLSGDGNTNTNNQNQQQQNQQPQDIPKTNKPKVELFVMSHCPYGTQAEKGILPVTELLGNKIDFDIKFVYYAMHGEVEVQEQARQYCIQKEQNTKFSTYLACFLKDGDSGTCLAETNINTNQLDVCMQSADSEFKLSENLNNQATWLNGRFPLFDIHKADNEKYSIGGSPTLVVNGVQASSGRNSASYLQTICSAFTNPPAECDEELSSDNPSPGFGFSTTGDEGAAGVCG